jgi:hypothetical protein
MHILLFFFFSCSDFTLKFLTTRTTNVPITRNPESFVCYFFSPNACTHPPLTNSNVSALYVFCLAMQVAANGHGVRVLVAAMRTHVADESVLLFAARTLFNICSHVDDLTAVGAAGGVDGTVLALQKWPNNSPFSSFSSLFFFFFFFPSNFLIFLYHVMQSADARANR